MNPLPEILSGLLAVVLLVAVLDVALASLRAAIAPATDSEPTP